MKILSTELIDKEATYNKFKITKYVESSIIVAICQRCFNRFDIKYKSFTRRKYCQCKECLKYTISTESSELAKKINSDPEYRKKHYNICNSEEYKKKHAASCKSSEARLRSKQSSLKLWKNNRDKMYVQWNRSKEYLDNMSKIMKKKWDNPEFKNKMSLITGSKEIREKLRNNQLKNWADQSYRDMILKSFSRRSNLWDNEEYAQKMLHMRNTDEYRAKASMIMRERWKDPVFRNKIVTDIKNRWKRPEYRKSILSQISNRPKISNIQHILYGILDDLNITYYKENENKTDQECLIGPYSFDCVIPRENTKTLLIECQGDYWHNLENVSRRDRGKATYIEKYLSDKYELKYLWEHEFKNHNKIRESLKYWLGISKETLIEINFDQLIIKECKAQEYKELLLKYHYLANAGRGGIAFGCYHNNILIAVCVFSPVIRQNVTIDGYEQSQIRELSRLCIHPNYQHKNLASWFISRAIKLLDNKYKVIISYCDTTFNHTGAIYKALNFTCDREIKPDYWYCSEDGWVMHKKTLYEHANSLQLTERQFAEQYNYKKIYGDKKLRYIFIR